MQFPVINEVEAYWEGLRGGRGLPARAQIDPRGLERALDRAFVLERIAPGIVRFRLAGNRLHELMGMDVRGMPLSALFRAEAREELTFHLEAVFDAPQVVRLTLADSRGIGRPALAAEMILLPLLDDKATASRALGCLDVSGQPGLAPRRFRITGARIRTLDPAVPHAVADPAPAPPPAPVSGMAESAAGFAAHPGATAKRPGGARPALRLVKSAD